MPAILPIPVEVTQKLELPEGADPDGSSEVSFRAATIAEQEQIAELSAYEERTYTQEGTKGRFRYNPYEIVRKQVFLTMTGCNLMQPDAKDPDNREKDKPLFAFKKTGFKTKLAMQEKDFNELWGMLPPDWAEAILKVMHVVNPMWKPDQGE